MAEMDHRAGSAHQISSGQVYETWEFWPIRTAELHHFCDASELDYGTVSYFRFTNSMGRVHVALVLGNSSGTPLKQITIPRLELAMATLTVKWTGCWKGSSKRYLKTLFSGQIAHLCWHISIIKQKDSILSWPTEFQWSMTYSKRNNGDVWAQRTTQLMMHHIYLVSEIIEMAEGSDLSGKGGHWLARDPYKTGTNSSKQSRGQKGCFC